MLALERRIGLEQSEYEMADRRTVGEGEDFNNKACLIHTAGCRETKRTSEILLFD